MKGYLARRYDNRLYQYIYERGIVRCALYFDQVMPLQADTF